MIRNSDSSRDYVLRGSEIRNPAIWEIKNLEFFPVHFGGSEFLNPASPAYDLWRIRNSESSPMFL